MMEKIYTVKNDRGRWQAYTRTLLGTGIYNYYSRDSWGQPVGGYSLRAVLELARDYAHRSGARRALSRPPVR